MEEVRRYLNVPYFFLYPDIYKVLKMLLCRRYFVLFKIFYYYTIVCKPQPLRHDISRKGGQINVPFFASCSYFLAL